ncbi:hypothetical protein QE152_g5360 [Popillia japonica]|uniref:Uncharacterized protein n=1 Tax=Popillia japonica TaxID=7064 RepID=A0AAW1MMK5_POPJA
MSTPLFRDVYPRSSVVALSACPLLFGYLGELVIISKFQSFAKALHLLELKGILSQSTMTALNFAFTIPNSLKKKQSVVWAKKYCCVNLSTNLFLFVSVVQT